MKKILGALLAGVMILVLMAGCSNEKEEKLQAIKTIEGSLVATEDNLDKKFEGKEEEAFKALADGTMIKEVDKIQKTFESNLKEVNGAKGLEYEDMKEIKDLSTKYLTNNFIIAEETKKMLVIVKKAGILGLFGYDTKVLDKAKSDNEAIVKELKEKLEAKKAELNKK